MVGSTEEKTIGRRCIYFAQMLYIFDLTISTEQIVSRLSITNSNEGLGSEVFNPNLK